VSSTGDASRFRQILTEYEKAPAVTRERMYLETMEKILNSTSKVLIDSKSGQNLLYLPLNQLMQAAGATVAAPSDMAPRTTVTVPELPAAAAPADAARARDAARTRDREAR